MFPSRAGWCKQFESGGLEAPKDRVWGGALPLLKNLSQNIFECFISKWHILVAYGVII